MSCDSDCANAANFVTKLPLTASAAREVEISQPMRLLGVGR